MGSGIGTPDRVNIPYLVHGTHLCPMMLQGQMARKI